MEEYHRRVTAVTPVPHAAMTSTALLTGATVIPLEDLGDFTDAGGSMRRRDNGVVHAYVDADDGEESGVPSITLEAPGLLTDLPVESILEEWNATKSEVVTDWVATVTDEVDGSSNTAYLSHNMIALIASGIPVVGESVVVQVDEGGTWWVVNVLGATPGYDPGFIRTGGLGADTVVWAGTENGRRAQLDGIDGALECYNSSNVQTVNFDGEDNWAEGTFATAASGGRVEMGPGALGGDPTDETRYYTDHADELDPAVVRTRTVNIDPGVDAGVVEIVGADWDGDAGTQASLVLLTGSTQSDSTASLSAHDINLTATGGVNVSGTLNATMGAGSVGTGTFKDSTIAAIPAASETVAGKAEIATQTEVNTGTDDARIVTPLKLATYVPAASTTAAGKVELATDAEAAAGTDATRAVTPANLGALAYSERAADGTQTITTGAAAAVVLWATSTVAERGGLSYSAGVFTVTVAGTYLVTTNLLFASNATGRRQAAIRKNGTAVTNANVAAPSAGQASASSAFLFTCAASDTIDVTAFQDSGSNLAIASASKITIKNLGA